MTTARTIRKSPCAGWKMPFGIRELEGLVRAMLRRAERERAECDLALLDDAAMQKLHAECLGLAGPTNILAFPASAATGRAGGIFPLGSLALSVDTLHRECFLYGQDKEEYCIRLLAHGLAHLLGYDHGPGMNAFAQGLEEAALEEWQKNSRVLTYG